MEDSNMNIVNKVTLQHLKQNKKRTIVTIVGIIISVAMITAVSTIACSFIDLLKRSEIADSGNWHVSYDNVTSDSINTISSDDRVETYSVVADGGFTDFSISDNPYKKYIELKKCSKSTFDNFSFKLTDGRLPENSDEIVLSKHINANGGKYKVGDKITLTAGSRYYVPTAGDKVELSISDYYIPEDESGKEVLETKGESKEYTIVGIVERNDIEPRSSAGFYVYTLDSTLNSEGNNKIYCVLSDVNSDISDYCTELAKKAGLTIESIEYHDMLLAYSGASSDIGFNTMLDTITVILIAIIMLGAISLIYNSFAISISERSRYLGMLASVGATKAQKRKSVFFEGIIVSIISIPLGIIAGFGGMWVTFKIINPLIIDSLGISEGFIAVIDNKYLIMAIVFSILTIAISTYIPAKRASKITPIDAIRQTTDIKIKSKHVKNSKLVYKIFGFEGDLALKNLKRNKKRYRATVFSLAISMILFLSVSSFSYYFMQSFELARQDTNYDIIVNEYNSDEASDELLFSELSKIDEITEYNTISQINFSMSADGTYESGIISEDYLECIKKAYEKINMTTEEINDVMKNDNPSVMIIGISNTSYEKYAKDSGIDTSVEDKDSYSGIVVNRAKLRAGMSFTETDITNLKKGDLLELNYNYNIGIDKNTDINTPNTDSDGDNTTDNNIEKSYEIKPITITGVSKEVPLGLSYTSNAFEPVYIVINKDTMKAVIDEMSQQIANAYQEAGVNKDSSERLMNSAFVATSDDCEKVMSQINEKIEEMDNSNNYYAYSMEEMVTQMRNIGIMAAVFAYGFIVLITLICVANILNTISTSIGLRRREFAMLRSVGMTPKSFNKMIVFESLFYGIKSIIIGLPLSFICMYLIYKSISQSFYTAFTIPVMSVAIAIVFIFIVVGCAMLYSVSKIKKENLIDGLKSE